jgi:DNA-binding XRE family transcriptional regulator
MSKNNLKKFREEIMLSKAELARKAKVSSITIGRIEDGMPCRLETIGMLTNFMHNTISIHHISVDTFNTTKKNAYLTGHTFWIPKCIY